MQENNESNLPTNTNTNTVQEAKMDEASTMSSINASDSASAQNKPSLNLKRYVLTALAVLLLTGGLMFILEKEGRISTGIFGEMKDTSPVAVVNGTNVSREDYDSSMNQLLLMAAEEGADTSDPTVVSNFSTQAIDTLVNGELLRQAAIEAGMEASAEAVDARYAEIEAGLGGPELLAARMNEFGITDEVLRRDIANEILIQGLLDTRVTDEAEVTDGEVETFYAEIGGEEAGLPPLEDIRSELAEQIRINRQQEEISFYLEELRAAAEIEILI